MVVIYTINNEKFGRFLSELRREKGLTQKELAAQLFVSDKAVSKWERGLSLPDIALLQPIADIFSITITELLSGQHIGADAPMTVTEVEPLLNDALRMTALKNRGPFSRRWGLLYLGGLLLGMLFLLLPQAAGMRWDDYASLLWLPPAMGAGFGLYFIFGAQEKLPAFYDENRLSFYSDGIFRMNLPGVAFNNRSWPHILFAARCWCCAVMAGWPPLYFLLRRLLALFPLPEKAMLLILLPIALGAILGGLFLPIFFAGRKYR